MLRFEMVEKLKDVDSDTYFTSLHLVTVVTWSRGGSAVGQV